jgi:hypothetical protein
MPTNRRKRVYKRIDRPVSPWVARFRRYGIAPEQGTPDGSQYFDWLLCGEPTPGLPDWDTPEGRRLFGRQIERERRLAGRKC